jgi:hypothetical protein
MSESGISEDVQKRWHVDADRLRYQQLRQPVPQLISGWTVLNDDVPRLRTSPFEKDLIA